MLETDRFYRNWHNGRFTGFTIRYKETDLWIGVDIFNRNMLEDTYALVVKLREEIELTIDRNPAFLTSFEPLNLNDDINRPEVIRQMLFASTVASVGPMAAVAGAIAQEVGKFLLDKFHCKEVIVENGGDIFIENTEPITTAIYAGNSPLSGKIGLEIPPGMHGVCTSSGTVGHSFSFGKADAVTIVCDSASISDAFATAYCNKVNGEEDIEEVLKSGLNEYVQTIVIVYKDKLGIAGKHKIKLIEESSS